MESDSIVRVIEQQNWLEPLEENLQQSLDAAFAGDTKRGKPIENALHGVWLGHALHPVLTDIPVGAWTVALLLDLVEEVTGTREYRAGTDAAVLIGLAGATGAAVTGLTDWKSISKPARRTGIVHGLLNSVAMGLYVASAVQRSRRSRTSARAFSYLGYALAMSSAWLGGHLVYANQIAVERRSPQEPPTDFEPVLAAEQLADLKPTKARFQEYSLVLVKKAEKIYALADTCTHLGGPLSEGTLEDDCIRCPWHGSAFRLDDGSVVESPAVRPLVVFETRVNAGQIEVRVRKDAGADSGPVQSQ